MQTEDIRAIAVCGYCGTRNFTIFVFRDSGLQIQCRKCGKIWEAPDRGSAKDTDFSEALAEGGDEPVNLVSPPEARCLVCAARRMARAKSQRAWRKRRKGL